ncbi:hypothetical protein KC669_01710 [Candidatus Dojkabacteria bacterium]|uniref:Uncharacterized protein n=1 Tax=Candidatus Dojkabacteria bacterium TaxID=2099670 RepID=A0A955RLW0_9BACT|nr:hypothetical protein [Candidatus Dojkabacteria bacterium]
MSDVSDQTTNESVSSVAENITPAGVSDVKVEDNGIVVKTRYGYEAYGLDEAENAIRHNPDLSEDQKHDLINQVYQHNNQPRYQDITEVSDGYLVQTPQGGVQHIGRDEIDKIQEINPKIKNFRIQELRNKNNAEQPQEVMQDPDASVEQLDETPVNADPKPDTSKPANEVIQVNTDNESIDLPSGVILTDEGVKITQPDNGGEYKIEELDWIPDQILSREQKNQIRRHFYSTNKEVLVNRNKPTEQINNNQTDVNELRSRIQQADNISDVQNLLSEIENSDLDQVLVDTLRRDIKDRQVALQRIDRSKPEETNENDEDVTLPWREPNTAKDKAAPTPAVANLDTKDDSPTVTADDFDDIFGDDPFGDDDFDIEMDDDLITTEDFTEEVLNDMEELEDEAEKSWQERFSSTKRIALNVLNTALAKSKQAWQHGKNITEELRPKHAYEKYLENTIGTKPSKEQIDAAKTKLREIREQQRQKEQDNLVIVKTEKVGFFENMFSTKDQRGVTYTFPYGMARRIVTGIIGTSRLVDRLENMTIDNQKIGFYRARWRMNANTDQEYYKAQSELTLYNRAILGIRDFFKVYRAGDFVRNQAIDWGQEHSIRELARQLDLVGLNRGEFVQRLAEDNGIFNIKKSSLSEFFERSSQSGLLRMIPAVAIRAAASTSAVLAPPLFIPAYLLSNTISPILSMSIFQQQIREDQGEDVWKKMKWPTYATGLVSAVLSYFLMVPWVKDHVGQELQNSAKGVLKNEQVQNATKMASAWTSRMATSLVLSQVVLRTWSSIKNKVGWASAENSRITGQCTQVASQFASFGAFANYSLNYVNSQGGPVSIIDRIFDKDTKVDAASNLQEVFSDSGEVSEDMQSTLNDILNSRVNSGNEAVTLSGGQIAYLNNEGVLEPLQYPEVPTGVLNEALNNQPSGGLGPLVSDVARRIDEGVPILDSLTRGVDRDQMVVSFGGELKNVTQIQLAENATVPFEGRTLLNVHDDSGNGTLYYNHDQVGYSLNNGELNLIHSPETDGLPEIYVQNLDNPQEYYDVLEVESYISGARSDIPNPTFLSINKDGVSFVLTPVEDVPNVDDSIFEGRATYVNPLDLNSNNIYDASGNIIGFRAENIKIPIEGREFSINDTYAIQSPTEANQYFIPVTNSSRIGLERDTDGQFVVNKVVFNDREYLYGQSPDEAGTVFYYPGSATENPSAVELIRDATTGGVTVQEVFKINPTNDPNVFELPFGVDPNNLASLQEQASTIDQIDFFTTNDAGKIVGIGPAGNGIRRVFESTGHAPGSTLRLIENQRVIGNNIHTIATGNLQNGSVQYLVPADGSADPGDLVYSLNSEAPTTFAPNATHTAYLMGTTAGELPATIVFDNGGNIISFNGTNLTLENGSLNYDLINTIHRDFGIDTNRPISLDRSNLDVTYRRIEDTTEFNPLPEQPVTPEAANLPESPAAAPAAIPENNGNLLDAAQNGQGQTTNLPGQVSGLPVPGRIESGSESVEGPFTNTLPGRAETGGELVNSSNTKPVVTTSTVVDPRILEQALRAENYAYGYNTGAMYVATDVYNQLSSINTETEFNNFMREFGIASLPEGIDANYYIGNVENQWKLSFDVAEAITHTNQLDKLQGLRDSSNPLTETRDIVNAWRQGVQDSDYTVNVDNYTDYTTPLRVAIENTESASQNTQLTGPLSGNNSSVEDLMRTLSVNGIEYNVTIGPDGEIVVTYLDPNTNEVRTMQGNNELTFQIPLILKQKINGDPGLLELIGNGIGDVLEAGQSVLEQVLDAGGDALNKLDRGLNRELGSGDDSVGLFQNLISENLGEGTRAGQELRSIIDPIPNVSTLSLIGVAALGFNNDRYIGRSIRLLPNYILGSTRFLDRAAAKSPRSPVGIAGRILIPQSKRAELDIIRMERNQKKLRDLMDKIDLMKVNRGYGVPGVAITATTGPEADFKSDQVKKAQKIVDRMKKYSTRYALDSKQIKRTEVKAKLDKRQADVGAAHTSLVSRIANI